MPSKIVLYKGARGSGKTLTMVKDAYKYHKNNWKVLRNIYAKFGNKITEEEVLNLDKHSNISNCVIMLDELQIFFDSRRSTSHENVNFSNFIQQIRKRNIILLGTAQFSNTVDLRFRQHIDITAQPKFYKEYPICEVIYIDMTTVEDDLLSTIKEPKYKEIVYNPKPIFNLYNTNEMLEGDKNG